MRSPQGFVALGLLAAFCAGCSKKIPEPDLAYHHSAQGVNDKIQEIQPLLEEALGKSDFQFIHDYMFYLQGLLSALEPKLEGAQKERLDPVLKELIRLSHDLDATAGRRDEAATRTLLTRLFDHLKTLQNEFPRKKEPAG
ncbi:MAG: hypothetical protein AB1813_25330 [Verrucomicrobiota bacterium]